MLSIAICVGSSCHLQNSRGVIEALRQEVRKRGLEGQIELKAAFCLGKCGSDGITISVGGKIVTGVTAEGLSSMFDREIAPLMPPQTRD
jgi:NADH:ubiquinone oxidoreductase subunit E